MNIAITGATGYLGGLIATSLTTDGHSVVRLVRNPHSPQDRLFQIAGPHSSDLLKDIDVLVHCAYDMQARTPQDIWSINVRGTESLFALAHSSGVSRTILLSSMSAFSGTRQLYGRAKLEIEDVGRDIGAFLIRPGLVYGPNPGGMSGTLMRLTRLPIVPLIAPKAHQFTVHQDDLLRALSAIVQMEPAGVAPTDPIGIANPRPVLFKDVLTGFAERQGRTIRFVPVSWRLVRAALGTAERAHLPLPVRSDSLLGLVESAPNVPNLEWSEHMNLTFRRFNQPVPYIS